MKFEKILKIPRLEKFICNPHITLWNATLTIFDKAIFKQKNIFRSRKMQKSSITQPLGKNTALVVKSFSLALLHKNECKLLPIYIQ